MERSMSLAAEAGNPILAMYMFMIQNQTHGQLDRPLIRVERQELFTIAEAFICSAASRKRKEETWMKSGVWIWKEISGKP